MNDLKCLACGKTFESHMDLSLTCVKLQEAMMELVSVRRKWESDKFLLRGALRIIREAGLKVGSTELLEAARKEDGQ